MSRAAVAIVLSAAERRELEGPGPAPEDGPKGLARRARIVLAAADGLENKAIVARVGADANTRSASGAGASPSAGWTGFTTSLVPGLRARSADEQIAAVIARTLEETPPDGTHWSLRSMARAVGYAPSTIHRIWQAFGLQPHRSETFKLSTDPLFVEKVRDIVGLYLDPAGTRAGAVRRREEPESRRWIVPSRCCPCGPARSSGATHDSHAPRHTPRCSRRSTSPPARSSASVLRATAAASSASSCAPSKPGCPPTSDVHLVMDNYANPQDPGRPALAGRPSALASPLHPDRRLLAQPGRALLRAVDRKAAPARGPSLDPGTRTGHSRLHRQRQCQPQTLPLDQVSRRHPGHNQTLLPAYSRCRRTTKGNHQNFGIRTLAHVPLELLHLILRRRRKHIQHPRPLVFLHERSNIFMQRYVTIEIRW